MEQPKKRSTQSRKKAPRQDVEFQEAAMSYTPSPAETDKNAPCCDNCGECEICRRPWWKPKSYVPVLVVLLLVGAFFLGMLLDKVQYLQNGGSVATRNNTPGQTGSTAQAAPSTGPLHIAKAIGMDANKFKQCLESGKYTNQVAQDLSAGQQAGVQGTPAVFINGEMVVGAQPYSAFKTIIDQELANPNAPLPTPRVNVDPGKFPAMGDPNAPVTIVEYADFQCPFCERFFSDAEKSIINDYVKTGKAKFYFNNYAFLGPDSNTAAEGAYCAQEQGKFWQYHDFMYTHQGQENSGAFSKQNLES